MLTALATGWLAAFLPVLPMLTTLAAGRAVRVVLARANPATGGANLAATASTAAAATDLGVTALARVIGATTLVTRFLAEWATLEVTLAVASARTLTELLANLAATVEAMLGAELV